MKWCTYSNLGALGILALALGSAPSALPGQNTAKPAAPAPQAQAAVPGSAGQHCVNLDSLTEQLDNSLRNMQLESKLANLYEKLAKEEAAMSSPELAKLQNLSAQLEGNKAEIEAKAEQLAAQAESLASAAQDEAQDRGARIFVSSDDSGGWLGVEIDEVTPDRAKDLKLSAARGVLIHDVEPDSPAAKAGLKENDVVLQYDGQTVEGTVQFRRLVRETPAGRTVSLVVSRDGATQNVSVELADRNAYYEKRMRGKMQDFGRPFAFATPNLDFNLSGPEIFGMMDPRTPLLGINAEDLSGQLGAYFGAPNGSGILVREVRSGTPAEKAGLKAGDVIVKVDGKPVASLSELRDQLRDKADQKTVSLGVLRNRTEMSVSVEVEKPKPMEKIHTVRRAQL
ncbi:MAG TPA: GspH/FimT family pseudopilin [Candidatus Acidoferrum sp.]|nr:GspH/FimT family pseudopilin [Candidatus Acidoferrum sp.]